jgi:hypothetical protein
MTGQPDDRPADETVIEALAVGIRTSIRQATLAEDRLTAFAFHETGPDHRLPPVSSRRYFVGRVLGMAGDPATVRLLELARGGGVAMGELVERADLGIEPGDRVALAERIASAAACGLLGRELEGDRVACTPLGSALLDLVNALEARLAATDPTAARP